MILKAQVLLSYLQSSDIAGRYGPFLLLSFECAALRPLRTFNIKAFFMETLQREYYIFPESRAMTVIAQVIIVVKQ